MSHVMPVKIYLRFFQRPSRGRRESGVGGPGQGPEGASNSFIQRRKLITLFVFTLGVNTMKPSSHEANTITP